MSKRFRTFQSRLLTGLLYALGFASPLMLVACYAPPQSELQYLDDAEVVDSLGAEVSDMPAEATDASAQEAASPEEAM